MNKKLLYLLVFTIVAFACSKASSNNPDEKIIPPVMEDDSSGNGLDSSQHYVTHYVGQGKNSNLTIDGNKEHYSCGDIISINAGNYDQISIKNLASDGCPIVITNGGDVLITGDNGRKMTLSNLNGVVINGDLSNSGKKGFIFKDIGYQPVVLNGDINNLTLQNLSFTNIGDYVINYKSNKKYNGNPDSYSQNLKFLSISCENTAPMLIITAQNNSGSTLTHVIKNLEIAYCQFRNSPDVGTVVQADNVEDYNIHHNQIDHINSENDEHNGIFLISGNGRFHHNVVTNHQGNAIRAWLFSFGSTPKTVSIYNNIVVNSRKYSGFEVQSFREDMKAGVTTYANALIFNNTCGDLNLSKDWYGSVVDVYDLLGGSCEVFNNLAFNFPSPKPGSNIWDLQGSTKVKGDHNLYFNTMDKAGFSIGSEFSLSANSDAKGAGRAYALEDDFYGKPRNTGAPSIGAIE